MNCGKQSAKLNYFMVLEVVLTANTSFDRISTGQIMSRQVIFINENYSNKLPMINND